MIAMPASLKNPTEYFILMAPAVTLFLALSARQVRISTIVRDNSSKLLSLADVDKPSEMTSCRVRNLMDQNSLLLTRYKIIQWALLVIAIGLVVLGIDAFRVYFSGNVLLLIAGIGGMGLGTGVVLYEIARAGDTLSHEIAFCEWAQRGKPPEGQPGKMKIWTLFSAADR